MAREIIDRTTNNGTHIGDDANTAFGKVNGNFEKLYRMAPAYLEGLRLNYVSANQISVGSGAAYVPSIQDVVVLAAAATVTIASITSGTMYHLYLRDSGQVEASTVGPSAAYSGAARTKNGDASSRYLGSIPTGSTAAVLPFYQIGQSIRFRNVSGAPYRVLSGGAATAATAVSMAVVVPVSATAAMVKLNNYLTTAGSTQVLNVGATSDSMQFAVQPDGGASLAFVELALSPGQSSLHYFFNSAPPSNGGGFIDVLGYLMER